MARRGEKKLGSVSGRSRIAVVRMARNSTMGKVSLIRIASRVCARLRPAHYLDDIEAMYDAGDLRGALATLRRRTRSRPGWAQCGDIYTIWAELELLVSRDPQEALRLLDEAKRLGYSVADYYYSIRAKALCDSGEYELGLKYFEKALSADSDLGRMIDFGRALTYSEDERAVGVWREVLERDPNNPSAHVYLGLIAARSGDEATARSEAEKARTMQLSLPDDFYLARLYQQLGEYHDAIRLYREAGKDDLVSNAQVYAALADCFISLGNARAARRHARRALRHGPDGDYMKEIWAKYEDAFKRAR